MRALLFVLCWKIYNAKDAHSSSSFVELPQVWSHLRAIKLLKNITIANAIGFPSFKLDIDLEWKPELSKSLHFLISVSFLKNT